MTKTGVVEVQCVCCKTPYTILVPTAGYKKWADGRARIQDAMPGLSEDERELLISGTCPHCWDNLFKED